MSLMSMRRKMASKRTATTILWILIVVFLLGVLLWSVPGKNLGPQNDAPFAGGNNALAMVGNDKITVDALENAYWQWRTGEGKAASFNEIIEQRRSIFNALIDQTLVSQEMKQLKIRENRNLYRKYAEEETNMLADQLREFAKTQAESLKKSAKTEDEKKKANADQVLSDFLAYYMGRTGLKKDEVLGIEDFKKWNIDVLLSKDTPNEAFLKRARLRMIGAKLIDGLPVNPLDEDFVKKLNTQEVKARWMFIAAAGKTADAQAKAREQAEKLRAEIIKAPESFAEKAKTASSHMTARDGGDLGWIQGGGNNFMLPLRAEYLAFSTKPGEISPIMPGTNFAFPSGSESGYGFLMVEKVRQREKLPKEGYNWSKERDKAMTDAAQHFEAGFGQEAIELLRAQTDISGVTSEVKFYLAEREGKSEEADALKGKVAATENPRSPEIRSAFAYEVAKTTTDAKQRIILYQQASKAAGASLGLVRLELGRAYLSDGQKEKAKEQFIMAETAGGDSDTKLREDLKAEYEKLGDAEGVKRMNEWLDAHKAAAPSTPAVSSR